MYFLKNVLTATSHGDATVKKNEKKFGKRERERASFFVLSRIICENHISYKIVFLKFEEEKTFDTF